MRRTSNLAFNREFPASSGLLGIPKNKRDNILIKRDKDNPYDTDAVGIYLSGHDEPLGWLYKKDDNRQPVLKKLDESGCGIEGRIEQAPEGSKAKFIVVFWL